MAGISKITHKGKEIIYIDYRGATEEEMIKYIKEAEALILKENKPYRSLTNISEAYATNRFLKQAKIMGKNTIHLSVKGAIVGISGTKKLLLNLFNRIFSGNKGLQAFNTEEAALEFLIK